MKQCINFIIYFILLISIVHVHCEKRVCEDSENINKNRFFLQSLPHSKNIAIFRRAKSISECIEQCCFDDSCDSIVFFHSSKRCLIVECRLARECLPTKSEKIDEKDVFVVLNDEYFKKYWKLKHHNKTVEKTKSEDTKLLFPATVSSKNSNRLNASTLAPEKSFNASKPPKSAVTTHVNSKPSVTTTTTPKPKSKVVKIGKYKVKVDAGVDKTVYITRNGYSRTKKIVTVNGAIVVKYKNRLVRITHEHNPTKLKLKYFWTRLDDSLANGRVLNDSDKSLDMNLVDLVGGNYQLQLTVVSEDNKIKSSDQMTLIVKEKSLDKISQNMMETVLTNSITQFSEKDKSSFQSILCRFIEKHLVYKKCRIVIEKIEPTVLNETRILFFVTSMNETSTTQELVSSDFLESKLKNELIEHDNMVDFKVKKFQSRICYYNCDGRGYCHPETHECICKFPWMTNTLHERTTGEPNCRMHLLLIIVILTAVSILLLLCLICFRRLAKRCRRRSHYGNDTLKYKLLEDRS